VIERLAMALPGLVIAAGAALLLSFSLRSIALRILAPVVATLSALPLTDFGRLSFGELKLEFAGIVGGAFALLSSNRRVGIQAGAIVLVSAALGLAIAWQDYLPALVGFVIVAALLYLPIEKILSK
jgi:hypothetical protein